MDRAYEFAARPPEQMAPAARAQLYGYDSPDICDVGVTLGWDAARATFFAQVQKVVPVSDPWADDWRKDVVRIGATCYEVRSAQTAVDAVRPWADVPADVAADLESFAGPAAARIATTTAANTSQWLFTGGILTDLTHVEPTAPAATSATARAARPAAAFPPLHRVDPGAAATLGGPPSPPPGTPAHRPTR